MVSVPTETLAPAGSRENPSGSSRGPFPRLAAIILAVGLIAATVVFSYQLGAGSTSGTSPSPPGTIVSYVNLTVQINATNGAPQFVPANFSVPAGLVAITIADQDDAVSWDQCGCNVSGTVGGVEWLNGTPYRAISTSNVAHTFTIGALGLNVLSPGGQTVFFEVDFPAGTYTWTCLAPCGSDGYSGFPMGTLGWMEGTVTVG